MSSINNKICSFQLVNNLFNYSILSVSRYLLKLFVDAAKCERLQLGTCVEFIPGFPCPNNKKTWNQGDWQTLCPSDPLHMCCYTSSKLLVCVHAYVHACVLCILLLLLLSYQNSGMFIPCPCGFFWQGGHNFKDFHTSN